jgi:hypothetical protein
MFNILAGTQTRKNKITGVEKSTSTKKDWQSQLRIIQLTNIPWLTHGEYSRVLAGCAQFWVAVELLRRKHTCLALKVLCEKVRRTQACCFLRWEYGCYKGRRIKRCPPPTWKEVQRSSVVSGSFRWIKMTSGQWPHGCVGIETRGPDYYSRQPRKSTCGPKTLSLSDQQVTGSLMRPVRSSMGLGTIFDW